MRQDIKHTTKTTKTKTTSMTTTTTMTTLTTKTIMTVIIIIKQNNKKKQLKLFFRIFPSFSHFLLSLFFLSLFHFIIKAYNKYTQTANKYQANNAVNGTR